MPGAGARCGERPQGVSADRDIRGPDPQPEPSSGGPGRTDGDTGIPGPFPPGLAVPLHPRWGPLGATAVTRVRWQQARATLSPRCRTGGTDGSQGNDRSAMPASPLRCGYPAALRPFSCTFPSIHSSASRSLSHLSSAAIFPEHFQPRPSLHAPKPLFVMERQKSLDWKGA